MGERCPFRMAGGGLRWRVSGPGPGPEPEDPNLSPDGRDLGPENAFPPPATRGCHLPPENGSTRAARGAAPTHCIPCQLANWPTGQLINLVTPCPRFTVPPPYAKPSPSSPPSRPAQKSRRPSRRVRHNRATRVGRGVRGGGVCRRRRRAGCSRRPNRR